MKKVFKTLYALIPFKKVFFCFLRTIWRPQESVYKHLHFEGSFTVPIDKTRHFRVHNFTQIENEVFWAGLTGKFERESMKIWLKLCEFSNCTFDLGANTGIYALVAKTINPRAEVLAFEPHPVFFKMLKKNVEINNYDIKCYQNAVSNINGQLSIEDYSGEVPSLLVDAVTLDAVISENNIKKIDLMKIDVETHEPKVMEGFIQHLSVFKPTFLIEIQTNEIGEIVTNALINHEYLFFNINERGGIRQTERIEKSDYNNYLACNRVVALRLGLIQKSQ